MANTFDHIIGLKILKLRRLDSGVDYDVYSPNAIILTLENLNEKLIISIANNSSSDIRLITDKSLEEDYGLEFYENVLSDIKPNDYLKIFIGEKIRSIRIAEFKSPEIKGLDFTIKQGKYAGIELKTDNHKLLFKNCDGGWFEIDDDISELPNPERWNWK